MICFHSWKDLLTLKRTRDHKRWWENQTYSENTAHARWADRYQSVWAIWNPLVDEKAVLRIILNPLWPSELVRFFNFHPGGNCLTMLCFLWKWPLWCRLQNFRDATWNSGSSSCPTFPSAGVTRWVVALNLKASIIIIHQARFGVKIPLPPSPESLWKICTIPAPLIGRQSLITSPDLFNSSAYQPVIQHCFSFITNQYQSARNHSANRKKRGEWQVPCQLQAAAKFFTSRCSRFSDMQ
jgi:hypothetical protein